MQYKGTKKPVQASLEDYVRSYAPQVLVAGLYMRLGIKRVLWNGSKRGCQERDDLMIDLNVDPVFDGIRTDSRFQDLVGRVGLPNVKPQA